MRGRKSWPSQQPTRRSYSVAQVCYEEQVCLFAKTLKTYIALCVTENFPSTPANNMIKHMDSIGGCFHRHWDQYSGHTGGAECILSEGRRRHIDSTSMSWVIDPHQCAAMMQRPRPESIIHDFWRTRVSLTIILGRKSELTAVLHWFQLVLLPYVCCSSVLRSEYESGVCLPELRPSDSGWGSSKAFYRLAKQVKN